MIQNNSEMGVFVPYALIKKIGNLNAAAFLALCAFLSSKSRKGGWFDLCQEGASSDAPGANRFQRLGSFRACLGISADEQATIRKKLKSEFPGVLQEKKKGIPGRLHYCVDQKAYQALIGQALDKNATVGAAEKVIDETEEHPRVLITVSGGVADYVATPGVECFVFDWDNFEEDPDDAPVAPSHFADLAQPIDVPYEDSIKIINETTPKAVRDAFYHVRRSYPNVVQVRYDRNGRWWYTDKDGNADAFDNTIDVGLLEDASDAVHDLPVTFRLADVTSA